MLELTMVAKLAFEWNDGRSFEPVAALRRSLAVCFIVLVGSLLAGCAIRPEVGFLAAVADPSAGESVYKILVATTRERDARPGTLFNGERASLDHAEIAVSVPQAHVNGEVELASMPPGNPKTDFVVRQAAYLESEKAFIQALNRQLAARPRGSRKVFLFIHGYNTMFAEGLYRFAQVVHDSESRAVPVLFTWASHGELSEYVYDTNSATAARDELEHTIRLLFASNAEQIDILAHSMGNWVTVEALRQIKMTGGLPQIAKLGRVFLASPDIDIDVFKSQMRRFGKPVKPFYVVISRDDRALGLSKFIAGGESRVGDYANAAELTELGAVVIDLSDVKALDPSNHDKFAQVADVEPKLMQLLAKGVHTPRGGANGLEAVGGTLTSVMRLPGAILGAPIRIIAGR
jgi:esterase/lipase superfamily enzyme